MPTGIELASPTCRMDALTIKPQNETTLAGIYKTLLLSKQATIRPSALLIIRITFYPSVVFKNNLFIGLFKSEFFILFLKTSI